MELTLSRQERGQLAEVAHGTDNDEALELLEGRDNNSRGTTVEGREDVWTIRTLAAIALEGDVPENYGFDTIEDVYDRASGMLFPESQE